MPCRYKLLSPSDSQDVLETDGPFRMGEGRKLRQFLDGTSTTVLCSEVIAGRNDVPTRSLYANHGQWFDPWAGGSVYTHQETPNSSVGDGMPLSWCDPAFFDVVPCTGETVEGLMYATARSWHTGGVNAVYADGHVNFHTDSIDLHLWRALSTIAIGEVVSGQ